MNTQILNSRFIEDYVGAYTISSCGKVTSYSSKCGKLRKPFIDGRGYETVPLHLNGKTRNHRVHRMVAKEFVENPHGYKCVNHIDGNKLNNDSSNLEWCTSAHNNLHARKTNLNPCKLSSSDVDRIKELLVSTQQTLVEIGQIFGVSKTTILNVKKGKCLKRFVVKLMK
tara:strand:+ start:331 stop:837 length:507 start_codon:yes stop_codon:yes gene_type:complete